MTTFIESMRGLRADGGILTFPAQEAKWSYAAMDSDGRVTQAAETQVISLHATVGVYYFRDASFIEVYLSTPLSECEKHNPHGLYRKVRAGEISEFTSVSSPYEAPEQPEVNLDASTCSVTASVEQIPQGVSQKATKAPDLFARSTRFSFSSSHSETLKTLPGDCRGFWRPVSRKQSMGVQAESTLYGGDCSTFYPDSHGRSRLEVKLPWSCSTA